MYNQTICTTLHFYLYYMSCTCNVLPRKSCSPTTYSLCIRFFCLMLSCALNSGVGEEISDNRSIVRFTECVTQDNHKSNCLFSINITSSACVPGTEMRNEAVGTCSHIAQRQGGKWGWGSLGVSMDVRQLQAAVRAVRTMRQDI